MPKVRENTAMLVVMRRGRRFARTLVDFARMLGRGRQGCRRADVYELTVLFAYGMPNQREMRDGGHMLNDVKERNQREQAPKHGAPARAR